MRFVLVAFLLAGCSIESSTSYPDNMRCGEGHDVVDMDGSQPEVRFVCDRYEPAPPPQEENR